MPPPPCTEPIEHRAPAVDVDRRGPTPWTRNAAAAARGVGVRAEPLRAGLVGGRRGRIAARHSELPRPGARATKATATGWRSHSGYSRLMGEPRARSCRAVDCTVAQCHASDSRPCCCQRAITERSRRKHRESGRVRAALTSFRFHSNKKSMHSCLSRLSHIFRRRARHLSFSQTAAGTWPPRRHRS